MTQEKNWTVLQDCVRASEVLVGAIELMAVQLTDGTNVSYGPEHGLELVKVHERLSEVMRSMSTLGYALAE
jgi:hypothetical protein